MIFKKLIGFVFVGLLIAASPYSHASNTIDRILVVVNDKIITESDLDRVLEPVLARMKAMVDPADFAQKTEEAREGILRQLIDEKLIISAANVMDVDVEESEIDEMMDDMRKQFPDEETFQTVLKQQGISRKKLRSRFKDDIIKKRAIDFKVRSRIAVSPGEIQSFYESNKEQFLSPEEVRVSQILIRFNETRTKEDVKEIALSIFNRINDGEDIEDMARQYSEGSEKEVGGDMGWVKRGQYMERIDRVLFKLKVGEISLPIESRLGFHVFKVNEKRDQIILDFKSVRSKVENQLYRFKSKSLLKAWLMELREDAYISYPE